MGVTENIEEHLSSVRSLVCSSAFYEERQEGYSELSTIKKNNFFVLPVCLSENQPFDAGTTETCDERTGSWNDRLFRVTSWALVIPCWCEGSSLTHARSSCSCFRCSMASRYYTTTRLYGCTHNLLFMSAMDSLDWGLNNQMIYLPLASGTTWDSDGSLIGSGRFSTWFWLLHHHSSCALSLHCFLLLDSST